MTQAVTTVRTDQTTRPRSRRHALDVVRALAILCVLLVHCSEKVYLPTGALVEGGYWGFGILHYLGRIGVPFFLFLTGTLVASKRFETADDVVRFYKRSLFPLFVVTEVWCLIYIAFLYAYYGVFDFAHSVAYLLFLKQLPDLLPHWWYLPMIVSVYAVMPCVAFVLQKAPMRALSVPFAIIAAYIFVIPTYNAFAEALGIRQLPVPISLDLAFYGGIYGFYIMLGFYMDRRQLIRRVPASILITLAALVVPIGVWGEYRGIDTWYDSIFILVDSVVLFELVLRWEARGVDAIEARSSHPLGHFVTWLSAMSFAVYLVHMLVLAPLPAAPIPWMPLAVNALVLVILALAASLAIVAIVRRVPVIGKRIFFQKS